MKFSLDEVKGALKHESNSITNQDPVEKMDVLDDLINDELSSNEIDEFSEEKELRDHGNEKSISAIDARTTADTITTTTRTLPLPPTTIKTITRKDASSEESDDEGLNTHNVDTERIQKIRGQPERTFVTATNKPPHNSMISRYLVFSANGVSQCSNLLIFQIIHYEFNSKSE